MPFIKTALSLAAFAGSALAQLQLTSINLPTANSTLTPGTNVTVEIGMQGYIQSIDNFVLVIGLQDCYEGTCFPASETLGTILYQGPYTPYAYSYTYYNWYQDINVSIPASFPTGTAYLTILNLYSVGESNTPVIEYLNRNVTVA